MNITKISYGLSRTPRPQIQLVEHDDPLDVLKTALDHGVNFFDASPNYRNSQSNCMRLRACTSKPFLIATKVGLKDDGSRDFSIRFLDKQFSEIRREFGKNQVDVLQLNKPTLEEVRSNGLFEWIARQKQDGLIRHTGLIIGELSVVNDAVASRVFDCMQFVYNLINTEAEKSMALAYSHGISVLARSPLNSGVLSGKYTFDMKGDGNDTRRFFAPQGVLKERMKQVARVKREHKLTDKDLLSFSLEFVLSVPFVTSVLFSASRSSQVTEIKDAYLNYQKKTANTISQKESLMRPFSHSD